MERYDVVIIGTGPAGLGAAFALLEKKPGTRILMIDKTRSSSGGLRNDCKMNFTFPIGFPLDTWTREQAEHYLEKTARFLEPLFLAKENIEVYRRRAEKLGVELVSVDQTHLGTDGGLELIGRLQDRLAGLGVTFALGETAGVVEPGVQTLSTEGGTVEYGALLIAPGR